MNPTGHTGQTGQNWDNQTIWSADNLEVMRAMNSQSVDLIYLDPPFNSKANYAAPIGSQAAGAQFKDSWTLDDLKVEWIERIHKAHPKLYQVIVAAMTDSDKAYLAYMSIRLIEMHRLLKATGSLYLHCDPTMSHYLKLVLDAIFGKGNFRNEIVWCYTGPGSPGMRQFNRKHDVIFWYSKSEQWVFNRDAIRLPHKDGGPHAGGFKGSSKQPDDPDYGRKGKIPETWWPDIAIAVRSSKERTGYPTQKPLKLLLRIIQASSNKDDMVLDPFCGCATTLIAAQQLQRKWTGIDVSPKAAELIRGRFHDELGLLYRGAHRLADDLPERTDYPTTRLLPAGRVREAYLEYMSLTDREQEARCNACNDKIKVKNLHVDHIEAKSKGGLDHVDNLQLLCFSCNITKGNRGMEYLKQRLQMA